MSDHAEDVKQPVDPAEESSTSEQIEQDVQQGAATPADSSPEQGAEQKESGAQKRIRELTWKQREAERRAEEAETRLRELESRKPDQPKSDLVIPVESDYDDPDAYRRDLDTYTRSVLAEESERRDRQRSEQESVAQRQERLRSYQDRCAQYAAEHAEFIEDVRQANVPVTPAIQDYMLESDRAAELTHYLSKNPDHAYRIAEMSPVAAARELARAELELERAQPKKLSDAPPPMSDVDDGPTTNPSEIREGMTAEEFVRARGGYRLR